MVVLLAISTLAAALVPPPPRSTETTTTTSGPTRSERSRPAGGALVREQVTVRGPGADPQRVEVAAGDQLALTVTSDEPGQVSVPDLGLIEFAGPGNPARFDILFDEAGRYPVEFRGGGAIATVAVQERGPDDAEAQDRLRS